MRPEVYDELRQEAIDSAPTNWRCVSFPSAGPSSSSAVSTEASPVLDGVLYLRSPNGSGPWMVMANANGVCYEEIMLEASSLHGAATSLLLFNYRGVGRSTGVPLRGDDLVDDVLGAIAFLGSEFGVAPEDVMLYGHSMGGGAVALARAACGPAGTFVSDRSFASLAAVVPHHLRSGPMALIVGLFVAVLAAVLGMLFSSTTDSLGPWVAAWTVACWLGMAYAISDLVANNAASIPRDKLPHWWASLAAHTSHRTVAFATLSVPFLLAAAPLFLALAHFGALAPLGSRLIVAFGWKLDAATAWKAVSGPRLLFYHELDEMINFDHCSLYAALAADPSSGFDPARHAVKGLVVTRLASNGPFFHMYPVAKDPNASLLLSRMEAMRESR
ncbi:uncharacterized protein AMSG_06799 [Thecamonas trahens ATCC 50062]|uniref:AB hydrolase-1 domain-containing protein n=1 Tax=Thecamonas trahens ATCC 50062 TaxID=461836 RepID=A0A0L0DD92_THETB|nr:hypothetical protein AMSG_06799 [Thecamonas trahens ATCC 50062]KNC50317.1 hypothetical protein AMSG_06799 [Thecamonas trahens ATCC 50062]|eukprot:XP_013756863.1 hypothetical protein AMSG_06799 [Thecamonas trahens ATCC 50062]